MINVYKLARISEIITILVGSLFYTGCPSQQQQILLNETGITNLTQLTSDKSVELDPCYTKDGQKIIFASDRSDYLELWMMPIKGGGIQQLTISNRSSDRAPDISPDQNEIAFQSTRVTGQWNIWKISLGNRGLTQLTNNPFGAFAPNWSPDGSKIVYCANDKNKNSYVWVMSNDGESPTQLSVGSEPKWSPDGKRIVYYKKPSTSSENTDIWLMNSDGTNQIQITSEKEKQEMTPVWSPDGKKIIYVVKYGSTDFFSAFDGRITTSTSIKSEIWLKNIEGGSKPTQLTAFKGINSFPCWSPDGKTIAFISNRGEGWDLWTMSPNISTK